MRRFLFFLVVMSPLLLLAKSIKQRPNVLLICVDDLRPELNVSVWITFTRRISMRWRRAGGRFIGTMYKRRLAVPRDYTLLTGRYGPANNGALFQNFAKIKDTSFPGWFRKHGYTTVSVGKVSHHPGGRGGRDWNEDDKPEMPGAWTRHLLPAGPWQHPRGAMHDWPMVRFARTRRTWTCIRPSTDRTRCIPTG